MSRMKNYRVTFYLESRPYTDFVTADSIYEAERIIRARYPEAHGVTAYEA